MLSPVVVAIAGSTRREEGMGRADIASGKDTRFKSGGCVETGVARGMLGGADLAFAVVIGIGLGAAVAVAEGFRFPLGPRLAAGKGTRGNRGAP